MILGRCPRCRKGPIFSPGLLGALGMMNETCPVCELRFLRETGYFLGAMYVSYGLGVLTILPVTLAPALAFMVLQALVSMPLFLRFSRVILLYVDQVIDSR